MRLDLLIPRLLPLLSRNRVQQLIAAGLTTVNGGPVSKHYLVRAGDRLSVTVPPLRPATPQAEKIPLEILYEDSDLVAVSKPAGMVVHPAPGHPGGTLVNALLHAVRDLSGLGGEARPGIIHRLDKGTSGVVLVAKHDRAHRALAAQFAARRVRKTYLALAWGTLHEGEGVWELPIGRDTKDRKKISAHTRRPRAAVTAWRVLARLPDATLLELRPETGRTHQIRVHLAAAHHPLLGDPTYGPGGPRAKVYHKASVGHGFRDRLALHAWRIAFTHPTLGTPLEVTAPLPPELAALLPDQPAAAPKGTGGAAPHVVEGDTTPKAGRESRRGGTKRGTPGARTGGSTPGVRSARTPKAARAGAGR